MAEGPWGKVLSGLGGAPGIGTGVNLIRGITQAAEGRPSGQTFLGAIPGFGLDVGIKQIAGGSSPPPAGSPMDQVSHLHYGQEYGQNPQEKWIAGQLAKELQGMKPEDAKKVMDKLSGTPLATDIQTVLSGQVLQPAGTSTTPSASNMYGIDPLGLGNIFSQTMAPWLAQQQTLSDKSTSNLAAQMQSALKGASPAIAQAYSVGIPELQAAQKQQDLATTKSVATAPTWDRMVAQLQQAQAAAKAAQEAYYYGQASSGQAGIPGVTAPPVGVTPK